MYTLPRSVCHPGNPDLKLSLAYAIRRQCSSLNSLAAVRGSGSRRAQNCSMKLSFSSAWASSFLGVPCKLPSSSRTINTVTRRVIHKRGWRLPLAAIPTGAYVHLPGPASSAKRLNMRREPVERDKFRRLPRTPFPMVSGFPKDLVKRSEVAARLHEASVCGNTGRAHRCQRDAVVAVQPRDDLQLLGLSPRLPVEPHGLEGALVGLS